MCILTILLRRMSYDNLTWEIRFRHLDKTCVTLHSDQFSQKLWNRMDKHWPSNEDVFPNTMGYYYRQSVCTATMSRHFFFVPGTIASVDKACSSIRPSSGLAERSAYHCGMRTEPVQVPISHHTYRSYTLEIHHRLSASVESNLSACGRPRRTRKRCIRLPP